MFNIAFKAHATNLGFMITFDMLFDNHFVNDVMYLYEF